MTNLLSLPKKCPKCGESVSDLFEREAALQIDGAGAETIRVIRFNCSQSRCPGKIVCALKCWHEEDGDTRNASLPYCGELFEKTIRGKLLWCYPPLTVPFPNPELINKKVKENFDSAYDCIGQGKTLAAAAYARTCLYLILETQGIDKSDNDGIGKLKQKFPHLSKHISFLQTLKWIGRDFLHDNDHDWNSEDIEKALKNLYLIIRLLVEEKTIEQDFTQYADKAFAK